MPGSSFNRVVAGEKLRIPARWYDLVTDMLEENSRGRDIRQQPAMQPGGNRSGFVPIQSQISTSIPQYSVLAINGILISPSVNTQSFLQDWVLSCSTPTSGDYGNFVITAGPIPANGIGNAYLFGACPCTINFNQPFDSYADITPGSIGALNSGGAGKASVLWAPTGASGLQLAVVQLGVWGVEDPLFVGCSHNGGSAGASTYYCSFSYDCYDLITGNKIGSQIQVENNGGRPVMVATSPGSLGLARYKITSGGALTLSLACVYGETWVQTTSCATS